VSGGNCAIYSFEVVDYSGWLLSQLIESGEHTWQHDFLHLVEMYSAKLSHSGGSDVVENELERKEQLEKVGPRPGKEPETPHRCIRSAPTKACFKDNVQGSRPLCRAGYQRPFVLDQRGT
jgi:hypothetical protein